MKIYDLLYIVMVNASLMGWVTSAKDTVSWVIASVIGVLTSFYMYWKYRDMRATAKQKEKDLK
jgi:phosphate/sulfate permease